MKGVHNFQGKIERNREEHSIAAQIPNRSHRQKVVCYKATFLSASSSRRPFCYSSVSEQPFPPLLEDHHACHSHAPLCAGAVVRAAIASFAIPSFAADKKAAPKEPVAETPSYYGAQPAKENIDLTMYARIRDEGFKHSHVMEFADALTNGIGPRLTGSPNMKAANEWTKDTLTKIGLENAHLEDWGEFGMGWQQVNTWGRMITPDPEPLWLQAAPWSPATSGPVTGEAVYISISDVKDLDKYKGKLKGKIVLFGAIRTTPDLDNPLFRRYTDEELKEMETYQSGAERRGNSAGQHSAAAG